MAQNHVHILIPVREILPSGFAKFAKPLATGEGRSRGPSLERVAGVRE